MVAVSALGDVVRRKGLVLRLSYSFRRYLSSEMARSVASEAQRPGGKIERMTQQTKSKRAGVTVNIDAAKDGKHVCLAE